VIQIEEKPKGITQANAIIALHTVENDDETVRAMKIFAGQSGKEKGLYFSM